MPLINRNQMPPGGFPFREPSLNWRLPTQEQHIGFWRTVEAVMTVRSQNPASGLNPSREAAARDVDNYTCARLHNDPRWCTETKEQVAEKAVLAAKLPAKPRKKCSTCGKKG